MANKILRPVHNHDEESAEGAPKSEEKQANSLNIANPIKGFFRGFQSGFNRCVCKSCGITVLDGAVFCERCQQANDERLAYKSRLANLIKGLLWVALVIGVLLGGLWVLVALVKFMWQHS